MKSRRHKRSKRRVIGSLPRSGCIMKAAEMRIPNKVSPRFGIGGGRSSLHRHLVVRPREGGEIWRGAACQLQIIRNREK